MDKFLAPWSGSALRHIPKGSPYGVLDFRFAGKSSENRWNYEGEPTVYLSSDHSVALAEFSRHFDENRSARLRDEVITRAVFRIGLQLNTLINICDLATCDALKIKNAPYCFLQKSLAREIAHSLRKTAKTQPPLVP